MPTTAPLESASALRAWLYEEGRTTEEVLPLLEHTAARTRSLSAQLAPGRLIPLDFFIRHFEGTAVGTDLSALQIALCGNRNLTEEQLQWIFGWPDRALADIVTRTTDNHPLNLTPLRVMEMLEGAGYDVPESTFAPFLQRLRGRKKLSDGRARTHAVVILSRWTVHRAEDTEMLMQASNGIPEIDMLLAEHPLTGASALAELACRNPKYSHLVGAVVERLDREDSPAHSDAVKQAVLRARDEYTAGKLAHWLSVEEYRSFVLSYVAERMNPVPWSVLQARSPDPETMLELFRVLAANGLPWKAVPMLEKVGTVENTALIQHEDWMPLLESKDSKARLDAQIAIAKLEQQRRTASEPTEPALPAEPARAPASPSRTL
jgi:hypothetical protein